MPLTAISCSSECIWWVVSYLWLSFSFNSEPEVRQPLHSEKEQERWASGKTNEKPSVIQTRRQQGTSKTNKRQMPGLDSRIFF